ncbi:DUF6090 family protein [Muriicola soli]|uniref:Uncharacterized protein n=1 Tax=Muriicola soli TaxID=2507538 RepID=A0A411E6L9_9FLAO|nr:DUF6090 family protein [Muriicola soli]QBA63345.1 hypothetical protein EQY75_01520 [Muriicola soli]
MISLFRRLRERVLIDKKVSRYLLYAIGEILLIVIGILLAVQVNDWNTLRNEKREEQQMLKQLRTEFKANRDQIQDKIVLHRRIVSSGERLLEFIDNYDGGIYTDSLYAHLSWTLTAPTFDPSLGVTNDLINSGKLYLIRNDSLRHLVSGWSGYIDFATEEEKIWLKIRDEFYIPYLKENFSVRNILHVIQLGSAARGMMNFGGIYDASDAGPSKWDTSNSKEMTRTELLLLEDNAAELTNLNKLSVTQMSELRNLSDRILKMIEEEIDAN